MNRRILSKLMLMAAALLAIGACPNPITNAVLRQMTDKAAPGLTITSPADNTEYTQTVTIQGLLAYTPGELRSVTYLVAGTLGILGEGTVALGSIGSDGSFSFQFDTVTFNGPIVASVFVRDWNDNTAQKSITLLYPGSSVSSFVASPSSKSVNLSWQAVAGVTGYTIYYTTNGTLPSETYGSQINTTGTSYPLSGLKNGAMHIFLLRARMAAGPDYWSGYVRAIPLSELTLAPLVRGGYREISLEWSRIEATEEFEVLRATSEAGPYVSYSGLLHGYSFTDTSVAEDTWYYYKVRPSLEGSIVSTFNGAQTVQVPTASSRITSLTLPYAAQHVRYSGNYAYVAAGANGLLVVDISNPASPSYVRSISTTNAQDLAIASMGGTQYLFLADGASGFRVFSLAVPSNPSQVGSPYTLNINNLTDLAVAGSGSTYRAFLIDEESDSSTTLMALNVSNPSSITWIDDELGLTFRFQDIEASYYSSNLTFMYIAGDNTSSGANELREYYLSVSLATLYPYRTFTDANYNPNIVALSGSYVYLMATRNADIEPPPEYALIVLSKYPSAFAEVGRTTDVSGWVSDIRVSGTKAYVVDKIGIQEYDVSAAATPAIGERLDTPGTPTGIDTNGSYAFLASGLPLFQVVDLRLPGSMSIEGSYSSSGLMGLAVRGDYVYAAAAGTPRLQVISISNPAAPSGMGSYTIPGARDVALSGPYAFVAAGTGGLTVVNVSNPALPTFVGSSAPVSGFLYGLAVKGDYVYAAATTGLQVYDVSDPALPVGVGIYDSDGGGMHDVELRSEMAYTTDGAYFQPNSLKLLDVSNPAIPSLSGKGLTSGMIIGHLSLYGDWAFVSDEGPGTGLWAVNINPGSASYLTAYGPCDTLPGGGTGFGTAGVAAFGSTAYVLDPSGGLVLIDIANPASLSDSSLGSSLALGTAPVEVILNGKYALATDSASGLRIVRLIP